MQLYLFELFQYHWKKWQHINCDKFQGDVCIKIMYLINVCIIMMPII